MAVSFKLRRFNEYVESSLFRENETDHNQFKDIFKLIEESEIIKRLNISQSINKEIAEFATGKWEICEACCESVSILHEDEGEYLCPVCEEIVKLWSCKDCNQNWLSILSKDEIQHCFTCGCIICATCLQKCCGCGEIICNDCLEKCNDCNAIECIECNGWCAKCEKDPTCHRCTFECGKCRLLFCKDHMGMIRCKGCKLCVCDSCNNVTGLCVICGNKLCNDCIKIGPRVSGNAMDMKRHCVCEKCCDQYKYIFKYLYHQ